MAAALNESKTTGAAPSAGPGTEAAPAETEPADEGEESPESEAGEHDEETG